jgi:hypothetical protein
MYMLKDETFFDSDCCLPLGLIAICPPLDRNVCGRARIKPQSSDGWDVEGISQLAQFFL